MATCLLMKLILIDVFIILMATNNYKQQGVFSNFSFTDLFCLQLFILFQLETFSSNLNNNDDTYNLMRLVCLCR